MRTVNGAYLVRWHSERGDSSFRRYGASTWRHMTTRPNIISDLAQSIIIIPITVAAQVMASIISPFRNTYRYLVRSPFFFYQPLSQFLLDNLFVRFYPNTATPGARVTRALLLRRARCHRPRARVHRTAHPGTAGLSPARAHTGHVSECVSLLSMLISPWVQAFVDVTFVRLLACLALIVPKRQRRPVQGYEDE